MSIGLDDLAWALAQKTLGVGGRRETSCYLFAAAAHGALRGTGAKFRAGGAFLTSSQVQGWGVSINPAQRQYVLTADTEVAEDGGYCGHCWVELDGFEPLVVDIMDGYAGPTKLPDVPVIYHAVPSLARSIRQRHGDAIRRIASAAGRDIQFGDRLRELIAATKC